MQHKPGAVKEDIFDECIIARYEKTTIIEISKFISVQLLYKYYLKVFTSKLKNATIWYNM